MKIGFDAKRAFANNTGLGNYSRFVIKSLHHNFPENDFYLYTPVLKENKEFSAFDTNHKLHYKLPSKIVTSLGFKSLWRSFGIANQAEKDHLDIYHGLSNELPFGKKRFKTVVTIHDLLFLRFPHLYKKIDVEIYKNKWKYACKEADKIIAISNQTAEDLNTFLNIPSHKIEVVYQGCNEVFKQEFDSRKLKSVAEKYALPTDFILNVGTVEPRKNALTIVKSLPFLTNTEIPLVIVGRETPYKQDIIEFIQKENLTNRVIFLHNVPFEDLPLIYQLSKLFIYPSIFEGFGIPIIEALNSGIPVISSTGSCFSEAGGKDSLYIDPKSPEQLAEAIQSVLKNPTKARFMIERGKEYVKRFESEKIADDIMSVYNMI
ncbi:MAG TPA: glycosyltransferase family 1 protein [Cytophagales bacterium]|nr:glycosyltransferase family 1 protein [Cytophagales bacterium]